MDSTVEIIQGPLPDTRFSQIDSRPVNMAYDIPINRSIVAKAKKIDLICILNFQHSIEARHGNVYFIVDGHYDMAEEDGLYIPLGKKRIGDIEFYTQLSGTGMWTYGFGKDARLGGMIRDGEYALVCIGALDYNHEAIDQWGGQTAKLVKAKLIGQHQKIDLFGKDPNDPYKLEFVDPETGKTIIDDVGNMGAAYFYEVIIGAKDLRAFKK